MLAGYASLKALHVGAVVASGSLFLLRGLLVQSGRAALAHTAVLRWTSYAIDSLLLGAALALVSMRPSSAFANGWLAAKLVLLVLYIALGSLALKRGRSSHERRLCFVLALLVFALIVSIARTHQPLGLLHYWFAPPAEA